MGPASLRSAPLAGFQLEVAERTALPDLALPLAGREPLGTTEVLGPGFLGSP